MSENRASQVVVVGSIDGAPHQPLILLEHHDGSMRELMQDLFNYWGFANLRLTGDHAETIAMAEAHHCDLIVLDSVNPDGTGDETITRIKETYAGVGGVPIIVISTSTSPAEDRFMAAGADAFITGPFRIDDLRAVVHRLLHRIGPQEREQSRNAGLRT